MIDVLVIGAGLLGCFAARALAMYNLEVAVLEGREDACTGVSKANTGIVYPGYDNHPGTLKARLCVQASQGFDQLCQDLDVPFSRPGSLMIARGPKARATLEKKLSQGAANGVKGLRLLSGPEATALEPTLPPDTQAALHAPATGVVEPWALGIAAWENAQANGVTFHFCEKVLRIMRVPGGFRVETAKAFYLVKAVLNCAGLEAAQVREMLLPPALRLFPTAADYLVLDGKGAGVPRHVLFFEPETKAKGLTLTPVPDGCLLAGPTERPWNGEGGFATSPEGLETLRALCREYAPGLALTGIIRSFGGLRPNPARVRLADGAWVRDEQSIHDFPLLEEDGLFSLAGIKTPGLTCAHGLGLEMAKRIAGWLGCDGKNPAFSPTRRGIPRPRLLSEGDRAALCRRDPAYGELVCHCRQISRGEVREAIRRGAVTLDGVKRRVGAGMGSCQGSGCNQAILEMLAQARSLSAQSVEKDGPGSRIVKGVSDERR